MTKYREALDKKYDEKEKEHQMLKELYSHIENYPNNIAFSLDKAYLSCCLVKYHNYKGFFYEHKEVFHEVLCFIWIDKGKYCYRNNLGDLMHVTLDEAIDYIAEKVCEETYLTHASTE